MVDGRDVMIGGRAFDLLLALIERRDRLVTRDELVDLVWADTIVEPNNLGVQISALRKGRLMKGRRTNAGCLRRR